ncbi:MAG: glucose-6-phosphate dehydrogenase assembly protein OpcA, partial [Mycobacteriales bacterium]
DPAASLRRRASDFVLGDTDLAWARCTPWRSLLASALDGVEGTPISALVAAESGNASAELLSGWLTSRLDVPASLEASGGPGITSAQIVLRREDGSECVVRVERPDGFSATLQRGDEEARVLPLPRRELGDLLAEELRRMDPDPVYSDALATSTGVSVDRSPRSRVLVWRDPAQADA